MAVPTDASTAFRTLWLPRVETALNDSVPQNGDSAGLAEAMRYGLLSPGKRLRPLLCLMAADACGGDPARALIPATAVEMVHAFSLMHDDLPCMDDDDLRRGRPTTHVVHGEALALLAGDALLARAFDVLTKVPEASRPCEELSLAVLRMIEGQAMDVDPEKADEPSVTDMDALNARKTGALITCSLRLGGMCAGASAEKLQSLTTYGEAFGLVFQITDDLLDVTGSEAATGKKVAKDASKGKKTYPHVLGPENAGKRADDLAIQAIAALESFGTQADHLRSLVRQLKDRTA